MTASCEDSTQKNVKVFLRTKDYIPKYWAQDNNVVIDNVGLNICLDHTNNATDFCVYREYLRQIQQAARNIRKQGFQSVTLESTPGFEWDVNKTHAFIVGYHQPFNPGTVSFPAQLKEDVVFNKEEAVIAWVRHVIDLPANKLTPFSFEDEIEKLVQITNGKLKVKKIWGDDLVKHNLIGLLTVGGGSDNPPCMYELEWTPNVDQSCWAGLVGKGITFDTGGYSLKPSEYMRSMHSDMGGAATCAGVMALAAIRGFKHNLKACLCCAENVISGKAMKVGDIITYPNGISVEIANTDAEGRLVLADGLLRVADCKYIVDCATLTGAAKVALGRDYNAALSINQKLSDLFEIAACESYEYAWRLPFDKMHLSLVSSSFADITNSASGDSLPGATTAAAFLSRFVKNHDNWLHIDLSASYQKVANACYCAGGKGHGVRSIMHYLEKL